MTEEEQISKAAVELVAQFKKARGGTRNDKRCVVCCTTSKTEVVRSVYRYKKQRVEVYCCFDGCGIEFFQRLTKKLGEMFGREVWVVKSF